MAEPRCKWWSADLKIWVEGRGAECSIPQTPAELQAKPGFHLIDEPLPAPPSGGETPASLGAPPVSPAAPPPGVPPPPLITPPQAPAQQYRDPKEPQPDYVIR